MLWNVGKPKKIDVNFEPSLKGDQNALGRFLKIVCVWLVILLLRLGPVKVERGRSGGCRDSLLAICGRTGTAYIDCLYAWSVCICKLGGMVMKLELSVELNVGA